MNETTNAVKCIHTDIGTLSDIYCMESSSLLQSWKIPLHYASERGHHDTVQVLLEHHADVNARDMVGPYTDMYVSLNTESLPTTLVF